MTLTQAKTYIARAVGGANDTNITARAGEALQAAMEDWQHRNDWSYLRIDTSQPFTVTSSTHSNTTLDTAVTNGFKDLLVGMSVSTAAGDVPAGTTIASIQSNTSLTLSQSATSTNTGTATFNGAATGYFPGIPLIVGTNQYKLPARFWKPYSCRLISAQKYGLRYIHQSRYDTLSYDQTIQGIVTHYTIYNGADFDASGTQQTKIKFFRVPGNTDVALLRYYRPIDVTKDPVDVPDEYLMTLLDAARVKLLLHKNATDERVPILMQDVELRTRRLIAADRNEGGEDEWESMHTPSEQSVPGRFDGGFWPRGDIPWYG